MTKRNLTLSNCEVEAEPGTDSSNEDPESGPAKHLPLKELSKLARTSQLSHPLFQPSLPEANEALPMLTAVVQGNLDELAALVKVNPALLFRKGQVTDPAGQIFYDVSPYQLMTFLCDDDMKANIIPLVPETMQPIRWEQYAELGEGGADLVKMDRDPTGLPFEEVKRFDDEWRTYTLLENPDGIVYFRNPYTGREHLYYVNQETRAVELIEPIAHSKQEHQALDRLYASFSDMEMNSSRRSNNEEHQLIATTMQHQLHRKGIQYKRDGIAFCDSRVDFNGLINAYRKSIRLYQEGWRKHRPSRIGRTFYSNRFVEIPNEFFCPDGDKYWCREVGKEQGRVMWLLQRICEKDRSFTSICSPSDFKTTSFKRGFDIYNSATKSYESVYWDGRLADGLGSDFAIHRGGYSYAIKSKKNIYTNYTDVAAICRLVKEAKANVIDSIPLPLEKPNTPVASADAQEIPEAIDDAEWMVIQDREICARNILSM